MGLLEDIEEHFSTKCLYKVLAVEKDASEKQLKKAYYMLCMKYHPDKSQNEDDIEERKCKFQVLSRVHEVLSNSEQRAIYDETGTLLDESDILSQDKSWDAYWRLLFMKITKKDIEEFEKGYKGSEKEKEDILESYLQFEGDMDKIMENVMCATQDDEGRIREVIEESIGNGDVAEFDAFTKEAKSKKRKRMKAAAREEREAAQHAEDIGLNTHGGLEELILRKHADRGKEFDSMISSLEAKYAKKPKPSKTSKAATGKGKQKRK